jgi:hypothetical protein
MECCGRAGECWVERRQRGRELVDRLGCAQPSEAVATPPTQMPFIEDDVRQFGALFGRWKVTARLIDRQACLPFLTSARKSLTLSCPQPRLKDRRDGAARLMSCILHELDGVLSSAHIDQCVALLRGHVSGDRRAPGVPSHRLGDLVMSPCSGGVA